MTDQGSKLRQLHWLQILLLGVAAPLLCCIAFVTWYLSDANRLKPHLENAVGQLTGRALTIKGDFDFTLGRVTTIRAKNIDWHNPLWSSTPIMLHIDSIEASIDIGSLRDPLISITKAQADGAELVFEWSDSMPMNWDMRNPAAPPRTAPKQPIPLALLQATINDVKLRFIHPSLADEIVIDIAHATESQGDNNSLGIEGNLSINDFLIDLNGDIGPFQELLIAGAVDYKFDAVGTNATLKTHGSFARLAALDSPNIEAQFHAADIQKLLKILKLRPVTQGPAALEVRIKNTDDVIDTAIEGNVGEFNINGLLTTSDIKSLNDLKLSIMSDGPSAKTIGALAGVDTLPDSPYAVKIRADRVSEGLHISQFSAETSGISINGNGTARQLPQIRDFDIELHVSLDQLSSIGGIIGAEQLPDLPFSATATASAADEGPLDTIKTKFSLGSAAGVVTADISAAKDFSGSKIAATINTQDIGEISKQYGISFTAPMPVNLSSNFTLAPQVIELEKFELDLGNNTIGASGEISYGDQQLVRLETTAKGGNLNALVSQLIADSQQAPLPAKPWGFAGKIQYENNTFRIESSSANIGSTKLGFNGSLKLNTAVPEVNADIFAAGNNLATSLDSIDVTNIPEKPFSIKTHLNLNANGIQVSSINAIIDKDTLSGNITSHWPENPTRLSFDISAQGADLNATLPDIPDYSAPASNYKLEAIGSFDDRAIEFRKLDGQLAAAKLALQGKIDLKTYSSVDGLSLDISGPRMSDIGSIKGVIFNPLPFSLSAKITSNNDVLSIDSLSARMQKSEIHGNIQLNLSGKPTFSANLESDFLNLSNLMARFEKTDTEDAQKNLKPSTEGTPKSANRRKPEPLLSSDPISFDLLQKADGELDLSFKELRGFRAALSNLEISATLKNGYLNVPHIQGKTRFGDLDGEFSIDNTGQPTAINGTFKGNKVVFTTPDMSAEEIRYMPRHDFVTEIQTRGDNLSELGAQLNGYFWVNGRDGRVLSTKLSVLFGDFLYELLDTLNPFTQKSDYAELTCDAAYLQFTDGIIETAPAIILQTDKISIVAAGNVNLHTEKIDVGFKTTPLKGIGLSASDIVNPFIKIGGHLSKPTIVLNPTDTVIRGGAAVATMGISLLASSMWNRWVSAKDACPRMYEQAIKVRKKIAPDNIPELAIH